MITFSLVGFADAITYEANRLIGVVIVVLGLVIAVKIVREFFVGGFKGVLATIIVGGIALWGVVAGPAFFQEQAQKEADAILKQSGSNPVVTLPSND